MVFLWYFELVPSMGKNLFNALFSGEKSPIYGVTPLVPDDDFTGDWLGTVEGSQCV